MSKREKTAAGGYQLPDSIYIPQWLARVRARCVVNENGCWIWQGYLWRFRNQKPGQPGYGSTNWRGRSIRVHRKMLELKLGHELPKHLHACHTCDTPPCCNPDHLYAATNAQNHIDGALRGRMQGQHKTHCNRGHEYTPENTYFAKGSPRRRACKTCQKIVHATPSHIQWRREYQRKRREAKKAGRLAGVSP